MNDWTPAVRLLTRFRPEASGVSAAGVQPWFPAVGAGLGLIAWVLACLCVWFGGPRAGAVLAALCVFVFESWVTGGRRYGATIRLLESVPDGAGGPEASAYVRLAAFQGLIVAKLLCYGVLAATDRGSWLMVTGALSSAAVARDLGSTRSRRSSEAVEVWQEWGHWIVACAVAILAGRLGEALLPALFSLLLAWLLPGLLQSLLGPDSREPGTLAWLSLAEALALVVLVVGTFAALAA